MTDADDDDPMGLGLSNYWMMDNLMTATVVMQARRMHTLQEAEGLF